MLDKNVKVGDRYFDKEDGWATVTKVSPHKIWAIVNFDNDPKRYDMIPIEDNEVADEYIYGR